MVSPNDSMDVSDGFSGLYTTTYWCKNKLFEFLAEFLENEGRYVQKKKTTNKKCEPAIRNASDCASFWKHRSLKNRGMFLGRRK